VKALLCISVILLTAIVQASAAEKDIVDYFLEMPWQDFIDISPSNLVKNTAGPGGFGNSFIDSHNGYIFFDGNGAQVSLRIALFRYANRRPLLAIAWGNYLEESFTHLSFYTESYGEMVPVGRAILPVRDSGDLRFELPRKGLTLVVRNARGKVLSQRTWNRERFVEH
jgi:hypothetical protein